MKNLIKEQQLETLTVQPIEANLANSLVIQTSNFGILLLIIMFIGVILISNLTQNKDRPKTKRTSRNNRKNSTSNSYVSYFDASSSSSGDCGSSSSYGSDGGGCDAGF